MPSFVFHLASAAVMLAVIGSANPVASEISGGQRMLVSREAFPHQTLSASLVATMPVGTYEGSYSDIRGTSTATTSTVFGVTTVDLGQVTIADPPTSTAFLTTTTTEASITTTTEATTATMAQPTTVRAEVTVTHTTSIQPKPTGSLGECLDVLQHTYESCPPENPMCRCQAIQAMQGCCQNCTTWTDHMHAVDSGVNGLGVSFGMLVFGLGMGGLLVV